MHSGIEIKHKLLYIISPICLLIAFFGCGNERRAFPDNDLPYVKFTATPTVGSPDTIFQCDASSSFSRSETPLSFRWDWENDDIWDTEFSQECQATHKYNSLGYKTICLEVKDAMENSGKTEGEVHVTVASKEMILIPAGEFIMGSPDDMGVYDEHPQHKVYLDTFYIGKYEVTAEQYAEFLNAIGKIDDDEGHIFVKMEISYIRLTSEGTFKAMKGWEDHPMVGVSWNGAKAYAKWSGGRLPTEAEWEKAARG